GAGTDNNVATMTGFNGALYIGGQFDSAGGNPASHIAKWDGTTWSALGAGMNDNVFALAVYNSTLYAGGQFDSAGGSPANHIAALSNLFTTINTINTESTNVFVYPNPSNGLFTIESSVVSPKSSVEIFNVLGEKVYSSQFTINNSQLIIDLSGHPAGIYIYKVMSESGDFISCGRVIIH
ncbi:MAG TPA: T9SS type A sorting domain-containing protein, partial [Bacteroidia bacterium]|nr:T9SS type A sorting domain-containing protein [Bacteroidia bacterium]